MSLSNQQLAAIVARAFHGETLRESRLAAPDCYELRLAGGERLMVLAYGTRAEARTAAAALRLACGEFDLPLPQLRAADEDGKTVGMPYVLVSGIEGRPLQDVRESIPDAQLYILGQQLGEVTQRLHRLAAPQFGPLDGTAGLADERGYALERLDRGLAACRQIGMLNNTAATGLRSWFTNEFRPLNKQAGLVHGSLSPATVLARRANDVWKLGGVTGWQRALGWSPAWDHTNLFNSTDPMRYFSLRVGYGNGYDERTQRTYEQVRETVMMPYRALMLVEQIAMRYTSGDTSGAGRAKNSLLNLIQAMSV